MPINSKLGIQNASHSRAGTRNLPGIIKPGRGQKPKVKIIQAAAQPAPPSKNP